MMKRLLACLAGLLIATSATAQIEGFNTFVQGLSAPTPPLTGAEIVPCVQATVSKGCTTAMLMTGTLLNVKNYGAQEDGVTDDSAALASAVAQVNTLAALTVPVYACVYVPAGVMYINSGGPFAFNQGVPGCILGDGGDGKSVIRMGSGFSGDLFTWSDAWSQYNGHSIASINPQGPRIWGVYILGYKNTGWPAATVIQNAINMYDQNEFISVFDVTVMYVSGYGFRCGVLKNDVGAFCREANFLNFRLNKVGNTTSPVPSVLIYSDCNSGCSSAGLDSSNQMNFTDFRDYAPQGVGLKIANNRVGGPVRKLRFNNIAIEGDQADQSGGARSGNLLELGDATLLGKVNELVFLNTTFVSAYTGYYDVLITGAAGQAPIGLSFINTIFEQGSGGGGGVNIVAGKQLRIQSDWWSTAATDLNIGPSSGGVASPIVIDFEGQEYNLNASIDATSTKYVQVPYFNSGPTPLDFVVASGTGTCTATGTLSPDIQSGTFACTTGGTAASTVTLTLVAARHGYSCWGRDVTNATTVTQTGAVSTTSVTLTLASVVSNDVIQFGCLDY